ncbi:retrotransposon [Fragilaria crotonensis]|nr:retrotransposon [Fragilaria crotonensis]
MSVFEESNHDDDFVILTVDIDDCPIAELPLTEIYDVTSSLLKDDYLDTLRAYITQQLEDTTWLEDQSVSPLFDAGFATFHRRANGDILSLRKPALLRLIRQTLRSRPNALEPVSIPILIRFMVPESGLPNRENRSTTVPSMVGGRVESTSGNESAVGLSETRSQEVTDTVAPQARIATDLQFGGSLAPLLDDPVDVNVENPTPAPTAGTHFRGLPVQLAPDGSQDSNDRREPQRRHVRVHDDSPEQRTLFQDRNTGTPRTHTTNLSGRTATSATTILRYGSESFEEYMQQFMSSEVRYKDFRKAAFQRFDSSRQDSFIHWYKLFCATCLQWGIWCPPYESVQEDNVHGSWWTLLPASVRNQEAFMSSLLYGVLSAETVFPNDSREHSAIQGCSANAGYDAIYSFLRLHHPRLQSVIYTVTEIPRQRRSETFSVYLRRLHDFLARERIAGRNYTETEALDLSVRNLSTEWRSEFRRLVERDRRTGRHEGVLPFHLSMSQLATSFMQYATEIGRDVTTSSAPSNARDRFSNSTPTIRRIETANSAVCLGCQQPGHTLTDCNRFVDYIVAESLAQRHPQLRAQVASAHSQFRSRINNGRDARPRPSAVRSLISSSDHDNVPIDPVDSNVLMLAEQEHDDLESKHGYQVNAVRGSRIDLDNEDFEVCFSDVDLRTCFIPSLQSPMFDSVNAPSLQLDDLSLENAPFDHDDFLLRRLVGTYDSEARAVYAHADSGSMACTTSDATLLYAYRPLLPHQTRIRLFDAGSHLHHPSGVGYLRVPAYRLPSQPPMTSSDAVIPTPCCLFVRTYHTETIPGVIISHCAIAKQLAAVSYSMTSSDNDTGFIRFPHRNPTALTFDTFVHLQPTHLRGGLTFTPALYIPTTAEQSAALPRSADRYVASAISTTSLAPLSLTFPTPVASLSLLHSLDRYPEFSSVTHDLLVGSLSRPALFAMASTSRSPQLPTFWAYLWSCFRNQSSPVDWLNRWLANNTPACLGKYVRMDGGGELGKCHEIRETFANFGYQVQLTGPDSSHQNGPGERPHQTIGNALRAMLSGAALRPAFWPYAFYHYVRLYNFVPRGSRPSSPHEMCGGELPDLSKLRTFGCRVHVRPTTARYGRVVPNSRLGIFLGYSRTLKVLYYYDLHSAVVKTATHARFDEGMNDLHTDAPPDVLALRHLSLDGSIPAERPVLSPLNLEVSDDPFNRLDTVTQLIKCDHPSLGFDITACHIRKRGYVSGIVASSTAARIRNVRRKYIGAFIVSVNDTPVFSCDSIVTALMSVAASDAPSVTIVFAPDRYIPVHNRPRDDPIHLSVDQLSVINSLRSTILDPPLPVPIPAAPEPGYATIHEPMSHDQILIMMRSLNTTVFGTTEEQALGGFTRRKLKRLSNWNDWLQAESKQLDSMAKQEMYGSPVHPPPGAIILRQHWNYSIKSDGTRKARNCCDGSPRAAPELKLANTYSSCIEQPIMRLFFALCANEGYLIIKVDATNAYANSPPPDQPTFVYIDEQYADWYATTYGIDISRDHVLPVQHALQGHPESGSLWERFLNKVLSRHGFVSTTHERSIYTGSFDGFKMLISRQVDDLAIGCVNADSIRKLVAIICSEDKIDLRDEGHQTNPARSLLNLSLSTIPQLFSDYEANANADASTLQEFETAAGFVYRSVLGAVIYIYVVARIDIGFAVTLLARFSDHPNKIHFDSLRRLARYLRMTKDWGLLYWRPTPILSLPMGTFVALTSDPDLPSFPQPLLPTTLAGYVDAAHATDLTTRRSITGLVFMLCGGPIAYKSKVQSTVSTSSTEAEFIAAVHAAKIAKYLRSILHELDYTQSGPTVLYEDNEAAILMINASRPTPRARHIDIQHFAIQEWKSNGDIILCHIPGIINPADALTINK